MALLNDTSKIALKVFAYLAIFSVLILSTTIVLHELGHFIVGVSDTCKAEIILLSTEAYGTFTRLECSFISNEMLLYLSSFLLVIPFALSFLVLKNLPERYFSLAIVGIGVFSASQDIFILTGSDVYSFITFLTGAVIYVIGQFLIAHDSFIRFEERLIRGDIEW